MRAVPPRTKSNTNFIKSSCIGRVTVIPEYFRRLVSNSVRGVYNNTNRAPSAIRFVSSRPCLPDVRPETNEHLDDGDTALWLVSRVRNVPLSTIFVRI